MTMNLHTRTTAPKAAPATSVSPLEQSGSPKMNFTEYTDVTAASYVQSVCDMARKAARKHLGDAKFLIQWKTANCGDIDNGGEVTAAFKDVFDIRTKAEFDAAVRDIQIVAMQFSDSWHRAARVRHTVKLCKGYDLSVTEEQVESTKAAKAYLHFSCRQAASELLEQAGITLPKFDVI
ncbi:hypothetical protein HV077_25395 (plasmid) [Citrobacter freundii]|uniref:Uncharacterized protein n=1 Tax=Citrobacter freundii TaxID=546 RepID=A0A7W3HBM5_CITFR|nr:hypothetical protein [Citrobacter freundii]